MNENISNINDISFTLPINVFNFNPCREWVILKLKFNGRFVDVKLIYNELLSNGLTDIELGGLVTKIDELVRKRTPKDRIIKIITRYAIKKRLDEGTNGGF